MKELLSEFVPRVYRFALRLTRNAQAAEDLAQETFLRALRTATPLREPGSLQVWLFRITVNAWRDQQRRGRSLVAQAGLLDEEPTDPARTPEAAAVQREELQRTLQALDRLPDRQREALYLHTCEGLSLAEIADVLGSSTEAVKANLCVARKKLREQLRDLVEELFPARG